MNDRPHDEAVAEAFRRDPAYAAALLGSILEDGDAGELQIALRQMALAFGGAPADGAQALGDGAEIRALASMLKGAGLRLAVQAAEPLAA